MRILWITYDIFNAVKSSIIGNPGTGGEWLEPLFNGLREEKNTAMATLSPVKDGKYQKIETGRSIHYTIPANRKEIKSTMSYPLAKRYLNVIADFQPDIIHIHGTELNFGLLRHFVDKNIPIVCSIQGIVTSCYDFLRQSIANINYKNHQTLKNLLGRGGTQSILNNWKKYIPIEKDIFENNLYFIGRTDWDKAHLHTYNPEAQYFHGEELLRTVFYNQTWNIDNCQRHRIFISSSAYALKGFHILLKAVAILKKDYPDIKVVAPLSSIRFKSSRLMDILLSDDYSIFIKNEIKRLKLTDNIELKQKLSGQEMANEYLKAHIFALPSFIENSPNALGEAMLVGTPTVVTPVGGVPSIVQDNHSTMMFPSGDYVMMAHKIKQIFMNDDLSHKLSENAKYIAIKRHNIQTTTKQYLNIYSKIIDQHYESTTYIS